MLWNSVFGENLPEFLRVSQSFSVTSDLLIYPGISIAEALKLKPFLRNLQTDLNSNVFRVWTFCRLTRASEGKVRAVGPSAAPSGSSGGRTDRNSQTLEANPRRERTAGLDLLDFPSVCLKGRI